MSAGLRRLAGRAVLVAAGAAAARAAAGVLVRAGWRAGRTNYRGATVSLAGGPALAAGAAVATAVAGGAGAARPAATAAALTAGLGSGAVGLYDDLVGGRPEHRAKGFHGHLAALREGRVTSGLVKLVGVGAAGLAAAALLEAGRRPGDRRLLRVVLGAGVVAGSANLLNLLDLRPGRALKVGLVAGTVLAAGGSGGGSRDRGGPGEPGGLVAGPVGAAAGLLGPDLAERTMLGDSGANALGAMLGIALAARTGTGGRAAALAVIAALTAASERVSFTAVIARTPVLRELDQLGRLPTPPIKEKST